MPETGAKYDIYITITCSNAFLLSFDLATLFTGRTFEFEVYPFSFAEFIQYQELSDQYAAFNRYLTEDGMSGSFLCNTPEAKYDYMTISSVYHWMKMSMPGKVIRWSWTYIRGQIQVDFVAKDDRQTYYIQSALIE